MFRQVWATLRDALPMTGFVAALYDPVAGALDHGLGWHRDVGEQNVRVVLPTNSYAAEVLRTGDPLLVHITEGRSAPLWWERDMATWMGVPLLNHDNDPIGILALQSQQADAFDRRDLQFLDNVSHQLTLNVLNAQLYAEARESAAVAERRAHNLALVHRMSRLVSASLNPAEVVRVAAEQITELFGINHSAIVVFAPDYRSGEVVAEYPAKGGLGLRIAIEPNGQLQRDLNLGEPLVITDPQHDPRLDAVHSLLSDNDVTVMVLTPMISRGRSFGLISLDVSTFGRGFTAEEEELCRTIAAQVGVALENARLHQNTVTRVEQELEIARSIQANLFPRSLPSIPGATIAGRCLPAFETGGDFYDVLALGDERYGFVIGDVSGKSLAAAMLMAVARSIVRSEAIDHPAPETVMMETNRLIAQDVPPNTFVALCYAVYNSTSRELVVANAGQITPLLRQADGLITWLPVQSNLPLGIVADVPYHATPIRLHPGDTVLFLTDGLIEAFSSDREMYGFERLQALFAEAGTQSPAQLVETLLDTVSNWQVGDRRHDDMTVIVAQLAG